MAFLGRDFNTCLMRYWVALSGCYFDTVFLLNWLAFPDLEFYRMFFAMSVGDFCTNLFWYTVAFCLGQRMAFFMVFWVTFLDNMRTALFARGDKWNRNASLFR